MFALITDRLPVSLFLTVFVVVVIVDVSFLFCFDFYLFVYCYCSQLVLEAFSRSYCLSLPGAKIKGVYHYTSSHSFINQ